MLPIYLLIINIVTVVVWVADKVKAKAGQRRIPERTLYGLIVIGGGIGALIGIAVVRHKSRHTSFWVAAIAGTAVVLYLLATYTYSLF